MKLKSYIVDTTLRDGEQSAGIAFSKEEKVRLALRMDEIGIYQIEAGIPGLGESEKEAIQEIMERKKQAIISAWTRMDEREIQAALDCKPDIVHMSVPVSYVHIYSKLKKNKQWLKNRLVECIDYAKQGNSEITVGFEDASRADISFVIGIAIQLQEMGIKRIRYADTVGVMTPHGISDVIRNIRTYTDLEVEIHGHNDFGMAIANSLEAAKTGAKYVDCTFMGIGERAGNCDFLKFIKASEPVLDLGLDKVKVYTLQKEILQVIKSHGRVSEGIKA